MRGKSRLDGIVIFHHTGHERNFAVTGSFKVLPLRFQTVKLARTLPTGWYMLAKRLANTRIVIRSLNDVKPVSDLELANICWRMRIRFGKLLEKVKSAMKWRLTDEMLVVRFGDVPFITDQEWYVYVLVPGDGTMSISRMQRSRIYKMIRGHEKDVVILYMTEKYAGILHFTDLESLKNFSWNQ